MAEFFRLDGRVALVTGAGRGIGAGIARRLHAAGARIAVFDRDATTAQAVASELGGLALVGDVCSHEQVVAAVDQAEAKLGPLSILVNNAGITGRTDLSWNLDADEVRRVFEVNVIGPFLFCKTVVPRLLERGYGRIVNVASIAGKEGNPTLMPYSASKAAVIAMTKSLAKELAGKGDITVNAISPAVIKHGDPRRRRARHRRVHDLQDPDRANRHHRRGRGPGPLSGQPGSELHHRPVLRHQRRPGHLLILIRRSESPMRDRQEPTLIRPVDQRLPEGPMDDHPQPIPDRRAENHDGEVLAPRTDSDLISPGQPAFTRPVPPVPPDRFEPPDLGARPALSLSARADPHLPGEVRRGHQHAAHRPRAGRLLPSRDAWSGSTPTTAWRAGGRSKRSSTPSSTRSHTISNTPSRKRSAREAAGAIHGLMHSRLFWRILGELKWRWAELQAQRRRLRRSVDQRSPGTDAAQSEARPSSLSLAATSAPALSALTCLSISLMIPSLSM